MDFEFSWIEVINISHIIFCYTKNTFSNNTTQPKQQRQRQRQRRRRQSMREYNATTTTTAAAHGSHHNSQAGRKYRKQQKPLTLYGIGLINQIMDFTLFLSSSLSFFLLSFWTFLRLFNARPQILSRVLSRSVGSMKFSIKKWIY